MKQRESRAYRFADFLLEPDEQRLTASGTEIHLRPKSFAVLVHLVENHPHLIDRQTFFETIWRNVHVTDDALTRCIREIRKGLGDTQRTPRFVKTIPKRGYAFIHPVDERRRDAAVPTDATTARAEPVPLPDGATARAERRIGIAVLPFIDMSPSLDQEYFCDGVAEEILTALARIEGLRVIARTSTFAFKGRAADVRAVGRTLDVDVVLEGSVRRVGGRLRITAQLVSTADGSHIWTERYDRDATDVFAIQDEIARTIAQALRPQFVDRDDLAHRHAPDVEAHRLFLEGRYFFNRRHAGDYERAIGLFERAIARDDTYAAPRSAIADAFTALAAWGFVPPREAFSRARKAALDALAIDSSLAEPHLVHAIAALFHERDRGAAEREFDRAFGLVLTNPVAQAWYAAFLMDQGRESEALAQTRAALLLDPLSPTVHTVAAVVHLAAGRRREGRALLEKALDFDPSSPIAEHFVGWICLAEGRDAEAETRLRKGAAAGIVGSLSLLAVLDARAGRTARAAQALDALDELDGRRWVPSFERALVHAALGDEARSFALVDEALARGEPIGLQTLGRMLDGVLPAAWIAEVQRRVERPRRVEHSRRAERPPSADASSAAGRIKR
jgi:TolB-like protein/Tfp pilus assembly protein PilF